MRNIFLLVTVVFAILRFTLPSSGEIHHEDIFKDIAHIWIGVLFGSAIVDRGTLEGKVFDWGLFLFLTAVEVVAFLLAFFAKN